MPLSKDENARQRQLANLKTTAATKHGAQSPDAVREAAKRFFTELRETFPSADDSEIVIMAQRRAQIEMLGRYIAERGTVIRHQRRGEVYPAAAMMEKLSAAYEKQFGVLRDRERAAVDRPLALDEYLAMKDAKDAEAHG